VCIVLLHVPCCTQSTTCRILSAVLQWFDVWKGLVQLAHYRKQRIQVFFFPGQVSRTADVTISCSLLL
jgi:hypothetical protein